MRIQAIKDTSAHPQLQEAIDIANRLLQGEAHFLERVSEIPAFDMSKDTVTGRQVSGAQVVAALAQNILASVTTYKPMIPWTRTCGASPDGSQLIKLNVLKLNRPTEDLVATLIHECVHIADNNPLLSFGHKGNWHPEIKQLTAPYRIDGIALQIAARIKRI